LTTKLKLLLDESVPNPLANQLRLISKRSISWSYVTDDAGLKGTKDPALIQYATDRDMIVVTVESSMNERSFTICSHSGIIVISVRRQHEAIRAEIFKRFLLSGYRKYAKHAVTYVTRDRIVIRSLDGEQVFPL